LAILRTEREGLAKVRADIVERTQKKDDEKPPEEPTEEADQ